MTLVHVDDPETGKRYWFMGCFKCGHAAWGIAVDHLSGLRSGRVVFICVNCGHGSKGHLVLDEAAEVRPKPHSIKTPPATL